MYPRLKLLHKILAEKGSLVISIGYQEVFNLTPILKELFASKQIACVTVQTSGGKFLGISYWEWGNNLQRGISDIY